MTPIGVHFGDPFGQLSEAGSRGWAYVEHFFGAVLAEMDPGGSNGTSRWLKWTVQGAQK